MAGVFSEFSLSSSTFSIGSSSDNGLKKKLLANSESFSEGRYELLEVEAIGITGSSFSVLVLGGISLSDAEPPSTKLELEVFTFTDSGSKTSTCVPEPCSFELLNIGFGASDVEGGLLSRSDVLSCGSVFTGAIDSGSGDSSGEKRSPYPH